MVKVSIIILNYNGSKFLAKLFETLSNQIYKDFEVIFVDNASTDDSMQLVERILSKNDFERLSVKVTKNDTNLGYCRGNNSGLKFAHGDYIVFLNNDTYVAETWLQELVKVISLYPDIGCCQSRLVNMRNHREYMDGSMRDKYCKHEVLVLPKTIQRPFILISSAWGASMIVQRDLLTVLEGFDPEVIFGDSDLCWRTEILGYNVAVAPRSICYHYRSAASATFYSVETWLFNRCREQIRSLIKCYSAQNVVKRLFGSVVLLTIETGIYTVKFRTPRFFINLIRALIWDLRKLRSTLTARSKLQNLRKISDKEIDRICVPFSLLLTKWQRKAKKQEVEVTRMNVSHWREGRKITDHIDPSLHSVEVDAEHGSSTY